MVVLIMGITGIGKTTIGREVANRLNWTFLDADDDHSPDAIARMAKGTPLSDIERGPWLERVRDRVIRHIEQGDHVVLACSALKHAYRQYLRDVPAAVLVVQLTAPRNVVADRLARRTGHFAGADLLDDQIRTLEPSRDAMAIDASGDVQGVADAIIAAVRNHSFFDDDAS